LVVADIGRLLKMKCFWFMLFANQITYTYMGGISYSSEVNLKNSWFNVQLFRSSTKVSTAASEI